jgi:carboxypeptidase Q
MEAARIIKAANLQPRRTIRIGLWSGEEQGIYGSREYVKKHFGYYSDMAEIATTRSTAPSTDQSSTSTQPSVRPTTRPARSLTRLPDYDKLSAYFNLDNGTGKIRGVYMQGNEAVRPIFRNWLAPFSDLGATTLTLSNTGGTDHLSFNSIGLPGFQFIQDPIEYWSRTHHSNMDTFDRIPAEDLKQASTILAAFAHHAAMMDQKLPGKPQDENN